MLAEAAAASPAFTFGVHLLSYDSTWPRVRAVAMRADALGYDQLLGADHLLATGGDPAEPFFEGWTSAAAWAALTQRIRIGLLVGASPLHHPAVVARMVSTIDHISGGRAILGLGAAWHDRELAVHGIDPGRGVGERLVWLDEALTVIGALLGGEEVTHRGQRYRLDAVRHAPVPRQARIPILVGAEGERFGLRVVARHADLWQSWVAPDDPVTFLRRDGALRRHCENLDRDPATIRRLVGAKVVLRDRRDHAESAFERQMAAHTWPEEVRERAWLDHPEAVAQRIAAYRDLGVGGFVLQLAEPYDEETLERFAAEVVPAVRRTNVVGVTGGGVR